MGLRLASRDIRERASSDSFNAPGLPRRLAVDVPPPFPALSGVHGLCSPANRPRAACKPALIQGRIYNWLDFHLAVNSHEKIQIAGKSRSQMCFNRSTPLILSR